MWRGWFVRQAVLRALILREIQSRYGRRNIGFLWLVVEPLILASVVTAIHAAGHVGSVGRGASSMAPYPFTVIGYCLLIIFRNNFSRSDEALRGALPMLYHAQITPSDIMLSRVLCETFGAITSFVLLMGAGILLGLAWFPVRPLYLFLAIAEISVWAFGLSLIVASYTHTIHVVSRFVHPIAYFMFPLSGAFFTMNLLPPWSREIMAWNPMMAMFETARYGQFESASPDYMYPGYVLAHCALSLYWGMVAIRRVRQDIHVI